MIWRPFFARVKVNNRRVYSRILVKVCSVQRGWLKQGLKNAGFFIYKNLVVRFLSSFAHYELTWNPLWQHCSIKILTWAIFVIRRKSFSVVWKIPYVKIQIFRDRSFTWFLNYFLAKFLEIVTTGSLEIGKFLRRQSVSIFRATAHALHLTGFLGRLLRFISLEN